MVESSTIDCLSSSLVVQALGGQNLLWLGRLNGSRSAVCKCFRNNTEEPWQILIADGDLMSGLNKSPHRSGHGIWEQQTEKKTLPLPCQRQAASPAKAAQPLACTCRVLGNTALGQNCQAAQAGRFVGLCGKQGGWLTRLGYPCTRAHPTFEPDKRAIRQNSRTLGLFPQALGSFVKVRSQTHLLTSLHSSSRALILDH